MILKRKINIKRKSLMKINRKSMNNHYRYSRKNQKGGNYFLSLEQPRIGGLAEVSFVDDIYAQSAPNINVVNVDPTLQQVNSCIKGGSRSIKKQTTKKNNKKGGNGNFSSDMNTRTFDCYQPKWSEDCV
jgi:hypothetical protein